jgi:Tfp pilus assembly protein PilF
MNAADSPRMQQLQKMLERTSNDPFLLYGIALEYKKAKDPRHALEFLEKTLTVDPGYCYAYYQRGQLQEELGEIELARKAYMEGIEAAGRKGDAHARSELEGALSMIE